MNADKNSMLLYVVTDRTWLGENDLASQVETIIKNGATFIQLREKDISYAQFLNEAKKVKVITDKYNIPFVINDNIEIAKEIDADGVHIGQSDTEAKKARDILGKDKIIGISAGNLEEAIAAQNNGADYIGVGAMFHTDTKQNATSIFYDEIVEITNKISIPVVAIGGINPNNIMKLKGTGVDGVAVISAIFASNDIAAATANLLNLSKEMVKDD